MQRATHPSPITIVRDHVEAWRRENRWSRETVADMIVQAHERIAAPDFTGIRFEPPTTDLFERMRVNADRVFRWLDDHSKDKNLLTLNLIWSVLAALPMDRRLLLVNDLMQPVDISVRSAIDSDTEPTAEEIVDSFQLVVEHGAAANIAVSKLLDGVQDNEPENAEAKLSLAASAIQKARSLMARLIRRKR